MKKYTLALLSLFILASMPGYSHSMWLSVDKSAPSVGETVTITVSWGHGLNKKEAMKEGVLEEIYIVSPGGKKISPDKIDMTHFRFVPEKAGCHVITAGIKNGFMTKTPRGRKRQDKRGLKNAISCMNYDIRTKAIIRVGKDKSAVAPMTGGPIEIVPVGDISNLKEGDSLEVHVLFRGQPLADVKLTGDYEGYAGKDHDDHSVSVKTDAKGRARVKFSQKGTWLLQVKNELPYPDREVCDIFMFATSLSLTVQ